MPYPHTTNLADAIEQVIHQEIFLEWITIKFGAPESLTRQLISEVGLSLPKVYEKLLSMGYPIRKLDKVLI